MQATYRMMLFTRRSILYDKVNNDTDVQQHIFILKPTYVDASAPVVMGMESAA